MANFGSQRGATNLGTMLMVLTFILLGGFMYWLYNAAEPTQPVVDEESVEVDDFAGTEVTADQLKTGSDGFVGQSVRLGGVPISQTMGSQAFFVDLPASENLPATPFLVRALPAAGAVPTMGTQVVVTGTLLAVSDSLVADWVASGVISDNDRLLVEFATHFIEAEQIDTRDGAGAGASAGS